MIAGLLKLATQAEDSERQVCKSLFTFTSVFYNSQAHVNDSLRAVHPLQVIGMA